MVCICVRNAFWFRTTTATCCRIICDFLRGIVDSADLPLNVSREALQDNTVFRKMQRVITKKVLDHLDTFAVR